MPAHVVEAHVWATNEPGEQVPVGPSVAPILEVNAPAVARYADADVNLKTMFAFEFAKNAV